MYVYIIKFDSKFVPIGARGLALLTTVSFTLLSSETILIIYFKLFSEARALANCYSHMRGTRSAAMYSVIFCVIYRCLYV